MGGQEECWEEKRWINEFEYLHRDITLKAAAAARQEYIETIAISSRWNTTQPNTMLCANVLGLDIDRIKARLHI